MNLILKLHDPSIPYGRFDWRREATHLLIALTESMWIAPVFAVALDGASTMAPYSLLAYVVGNLVLAMWLVRALDSRGLWQNLRQIVFLAAMLLAVLLAVGTLFPPLDRPLVYQTISDNIDPIQTLTLPHILPVLMLVSLVWWRGLRLAITTPTPFRASFGMRLGIVFFVGAALFPDGQRVILSALPPFFFFGLLGTSLARAIALREGGGQSTLFGSRWTGFMALAAGSITFIGFGIAAVLAGLDPEAITQVLQPIFAALLLGFAFIMSPLFFLIEAVVKLIISALAGDMAAEQIDLPTFSEMIQPGDQPQTAGLEQALRQVQHFFDQFGGLQFCLSVFAVLAVVAIILLTLSRRQRSSQVLNEVREDLDSDALAGLRDLFKRGLDAVNGAVNAVGQFGFGRDLFAALTVRRAYAQMAAMASKRGFPRAVSETPYEYRSALHEAFPTADDDVALITEAFVKVRYGEVPETAEALQAVVDALNGIKSAGQVRGA